MSATCECPTVRLTPAPGCRRRTWRAGRWTDSTGAYRASPSPRSCASGRTRSASSGPKSRAGNCRCWRRPRWSYRSSWTAAPGTDAARPVSRTGATSGSSYGACVARPAWHAPRGQGWWHCATRGYSLVRRN